MKKYLILFLCILVLTGCGKSDDVKALDKFKKNVSNMDSYSLEADMSIVSNEDKFDYTVSVNYLKDNYYKVNLFNKVNNHEQIILKNDDGVYVVTPSLNKSFKFQSDWPNNGSQSYLLDSILNDINSEEELVSSIEEEMVVYKCDVNYPNNVELKYEKIYFDKNGSLKKVDVYNLDDVVIISVDFKKIDFKTDLKVDDFKVENTISDDCCSMDVETTSNLDDVIYPLYIPNDTYLKSKETIGTDNGNRVILTFAGEKNFILVEEMSKVNSELEVIPVYGEPFMLAHSIGVMSNNSLSWSNENVDYYLASSDLSNNEMENIAHSLTVSEVIVGK